MVYVRHIRELYIYIYDLAYIILFIIRYTVIYTYIYIYLLLNTDSWKYAAITNTSPYSAQKNSHFGRTSQLQV